jgi:uncharacterized protein YgbK (DUF1537 family)
MRGQIGSEIDAIMNIEGQKAAILCPSCPANGRTVVGGHLLVEGTPVSRTPIGADPVTPVRISHIPTLLSQQTSRPVLPCMIDDLSPSVLEELIRQAKSSGSIIVCDAATEKDLELIASVAINEIRDILLVGSAGLANPVAKHLAELMRKHPNPSANRVPVIVAVGSVNPVAREQLRYLVESGSAELVLLDLESLFGANSDSYIRNIVSQCVSISERGLHTAVESPGGKDDIKEARDLGKRMDLDPIGDSSRISHALGYIVHGFLEGVGHASIVVTGGDVAMAVLEEFGCSSIDILDEVAPGIPICSMHGGQMPGIKLVTKAGGFGNINALSLAVDILARGGNNK